MRQTSCARGGAGPAVRGGGLRAHRETESAPISYLFFTQKRLSRAFMSFNFSREHSFSLSLGAVYRVLPCLSIYTVYTRIRL